MLRVPFREDDHQFEHTLHWYFPDYLNHRGNFGHGEPTHEKKISLSLLDGDQQNKD
jgi:hypothetical protein